MYTHIMNNTAQMLSIKSRNGLTIRQASNATSEYIKNKQIQKTIKEEWSKLKNTFEEKYSKCKFYDYHFISSFIYSVEKLTPGRLDKLYQSVLNGDLEGYLLKMMGIKKDNLIYRNTKLTF